MPKAIDKDVTRAFAKRLYKGTEAGYGKAITDIRYNSPDYKMLENLRNNVYQFSGAKNYHQLKALTEALVTPNGKLRSKAQFKRAAKKLNVKYVETWLNAEYDMAVTSARMASMWQDIVGEGMDTMLEFDAVLDDRTTDICKSLNGVRKPAGDSFWKRYFLPNHWGERSTIRKGVSGKATPDKKIVHPEKMPAMFAVNLAEKGLVFPPGHPYWDGIPDDVRNDALSLIPKTKRKK
ncbi:hypothetical protein [Chitinophaga agrisoli]|nr:hypothetical protein [Chitinophaga agrisoli]